MKVKGLDLVEALTGGFDGHHAAAQDPVPLEIGPGQPAVTASSLLLIAQVSPQSSIRAAQDREVAATAPNHPVIIAC